MSYRVVFSPEAEEQLAALYSYIAAAASADIAARYTEAIVSYCESLGGRLRCRCVRLKPNNGLIASSMLKNRAEKRLSSRTQEQQGDDRNERRDHHDCATDRKAKQGGHFWTFPTRSIAVLRARLRE
jgi:plasmid stabilization system protein ParE